MAVMHDRHALTEFDRRQVEEVGPSAEAAGVQGRGAVVRQMSEGAGGVPQQLRLRDLRADAGDLQLDPAEGGVVVEHDQVDSGQSLEDIRLADHDPPSVQRAASWSVSRENARPGPVA